MLAAQDRDKDVQPGKLIAPEDDEQRQPDPVVQDEPGQAPGKDQLTAQDITSKMPTPQYGYDSGTAEERAISDRAQELATQQAAGSPASAVQSPSALQAGAGSAPTPYSADEAAARARGDNDQADLMRLMYERYHQDTGAVQQQLAAATGQPYTPAAAGQPYTPAAAAPATAAPAAPAGMSPDEAAARARGDNEQADLIKLMYDRYHTDPNAVNAQLAAATGGPVPGTAAPAADAGNIVGAGPAAAAQPTVAGMLQSKLLELMSRNSTPTANDPEIKATLDASRLAGQRAFDRDRAQVMEQLSASGMGDSGAVGSALAGLRANRGAVEQQIAANTFQDAANRRVAELQKTLELAGNQLSDQQRNALQLQIAQLQDATQRYGISTQAGTEAAKLGEGGRQFDAELAEKIRQSGLDEAYRNASLGASSAASGAANAFNYANLDEKKREFDANMQFDKDTFGYSATANPILSWLAQNYGRQQQAPQ